MHVITASRAVQYAGYCHTFVVEWTAEVTDAAESWHLLTMLICHRYVGLPSRARQRRPLFILLLETCKSLYFPFIPSLWSFSSPSVPFSALNLPLKSIYRALYAFRPKLSRPGTEPRPKTDFCVFSLFCLKGLCWLLTTALNSLYNDS